MEINFQIDKNIWDRFAAASPQGSIYSASIFLDCLQVKYDFVAVLEKDKILAGAVVFTDGVKQSFGALVPFVQYQGILLADQRDLPAHSRISKEFGAMEFLVSQLATRYQNLYFCHCWRLGDLRPVLWHNYHEPAKGQFQVSLRYTGILDLKRFSDFESYMKTIRHTRQQEYAKADGLLRLEMSEDVGLLDELHEKTFARQGIGRSGQQADLVKNISQAAIKHGFGRLAIAKFRDRPVSAALFLFDSKSSYYQFGASDPEFRDKPAGTFLLLKMIKLCFEQGLSAVDFAGVNSPNRGNFKLSFNAELCPYFETRLEVKQP